MARPRQVIQYRALPPGAVATFVATITMTRPQPYYVLEASAGPIVIVSVVGTFNNRRKARRVLAGSVAATGMRAWVLWFNRKTAQWYYELAGIPIV